MAGEAGNKEKGNFFVAEPVREKGEQKGGEKRKEKKKNLRVPCAIRVLKDGCRETGKRVGPPLRFNTGGGQEKGKKKPACHLLPCGTG